MIGADARGEGRRCPVDPGLVLLAGLPGSGKSHLARALAEQLDVTVVSSDRVRRLLIADPTYADEENDLVHGVCYRLVQGGMASGRTMVLDATNLRLLQRERYRTLAQRQRLPMHLVLVRCPEATARARLRLRAAGAAAGGSEADVRVYDLLRDRMEPVTDYDVLVRGDGEVARGVAAVAARLAPPATVATPFRPVPALAGAVAAP